MPSGKSRGGGPPAPGRYVEAMMIREHSAGKAILVALVTFVSLVALLAVPAFTAPANQGVQSLPGGEPITFMATKGDTIFRVPPRAPAGSVRPQTATFTVHYYTAGQTMFSRTCQNWPANAQTAFTYAASIWATLVNSAVPIEINACWADMGSGGILGSSAAANNFRDFSGRPVAGTFYPVALANALHGSDLDAGVSDMNISYNLNQDAFTWYYGTDGNPPGSDYDFVSVVLHEIAHGLGFAGSMYSASSTAAWGWSTGYPWSYDRFAENGSGQSLIDTGLFPNGSVALKTQLTSNNVYFDGPHANAANGGNRPKLYAPSTWAQGSSYAHLDAATFDGTVNALMTWSLNNGESVHDPGPVGMGVLEDVGWTPSALTPTPTRTPTRTPTATPTATATPTPVAPDMAITKRAILGRPFTPGDRVTYTLSIANVGNQTAAQGRVTDTLSANLLSPSYASNFAGISAVSGPPNYVWTLSSQAAGASGIITVYAQIAPGFPVTSSIANSASVGCLSDGNSGNNTSTAIIGGRNVYLPVVLRNVGAAPPTPTPTVTPSPTAGAGWVNIITENFEGVFPGSWTVSDQGTTGGTYVWGKRTCSAIAGSYSGWGVGGGANGSGLTCGANYPSNAESWMVSPSFSLVGATAADVKASAYIRTEQSFDHLKLMASVNGTNFYGWQWSGDFGTTSVALDLANVPGFGSMLGDASVWIALEFDSDSSFQYPTGALVDSIVVRKCTTGSCPATQGVDGPAGAGVEPASATRP